MNESINVENKKQDRQKPPLSLGRIASEILGGLGMGFAVKLLVTCVGSIVFLGVGGEATTRMAFMATLSKVALPVYGIVCAVGVYFVGSRGNQTGSFWATLGGSVLGLFVIGLLYFYVKEAEDMMLSIEKIVLWSLVFLAAPIMATIGFNLTRRYKKPPSS